MNKYWIKERYNPQLGTRFEMAGQLTVAQVTKIETGTLYGANIMYPFNSQAEADAFLAEKVKGDHAK